jgi:pimeloyl-ACP methyl ester carboxylesterase
MEAKDTFPYLVIQGALDSINLADKLVAFMKENFRNVEIHLLEQGGHAAFYDCSVETNKAILGFVRRVRSQVSDLTLDL